MQINLFIIVVVLSILHQYSCIDWIQQSELNPSETFVQLQHLYQQSEQHLLFQGIIPIQNSIGTIEQRCAMMRGIDNADSLDNHSHHYHSFLYVWKPFGVTSSEQRIIWSYQNDTITTSLLVQSKQVIIQQGFFFEQSNTLLLHANYLQTTITTADTKISRKQGPQSILFLRVDFPDRTGHPLSTTAVEGHLARAQQFFQKSSYGQMLLNHWVAPPVFRLPKSLSFYKSHYYQLVHDANTIFTNLYSIPTTQFDFVVCSFGTISELPWGALATVGGNQVWYNLNFISDFALFHEYGHNMGIGFHSGALVSLESPPVAFGGSSSIIEYGDVFDQMGASYIFPSDYNVAIKQAFGWISNEQILTLSSSFSQRVTLYAMDSKTSNSQNQLLMIIIPYNPSSQYFVQFRMYHPNARFATGAIDLHMKYNQFDNATHLIDTTPTSLFGLFDAPLTLGQTFVDVHSQLLLSVLSKSEHCDYSNDISLCSLDLYIHKNSEWDKTTQWNVELQMPHLPFLSNSKVIQMKQPMKWIAVVNNNNNNNNNNIMVTRETFILMYLDLDHNEYVSMSPFVNRLEKPSKANRRLIQLTVSNGKGAMTVTTKQIEYVSQSQFSFVTCQVDLSQKQIIGNTNSLASHLLLIHNDVILRKEIHSKTVKASIHLHLSTGVNTFQTIAVDTNQVIDASDIQYMYIDTWQPSAKFDLLIAHYQYYLMATVLPLPWNYAIYKSLVLTRDTMKECTYSMIHILESSSQFIGSGIIIVPFSYSIRNSTILEWEWNSLPQQETTSNTLLLLCFSSTLMIQESKDCISLQDKRQFIEQSSPMTTRIHLGNHFGKRNILFLTIKSNSGVQVSPLRFLETILTIQQETSSLVIPNYSGMNLLYKWKFRSNNGTVWSVQNNGDANRVVFSVPNPNNNEKQRVKVELHVVNENGVVAKREWNLNYNGDSNAEITNVEDVNVVVVSDASSSRWLWWVVVIMVVHVLLL